MDDGVMANPPIKTGAKTLLSLLWWVVGVRGVDGVVGVLPLVSDVSIEPKMLIPVMEALVLTVSMEPKAPSMLRWSMLMLMLLLLWMPLMLLIMLLLSSGIFWVEAKMADMEGSGCGMWRLSERGLMPGDLSLWSGHLRAPLLGCLHPRGSISKLAC